MTTIIQQPTGALIVDRLPSSKVLITVRQGRSHDSIDLNQQELFTLYCELAILLAEKPANG